ncbi:protein-tyrosine-phosphatase [Pleurotus pulmonarius]
MDEIIHGLWIGDLPSALDVDNLKEHGIFSILSAMRGRVTIHETFIRHQILLDDTEDADILTHFLPSISFIQNELDKGRGVLVHCQAGMSRSVAIVAAYLMYTKNLDVQGALELIIKSHPNISPNEGFLAQLEIFHKAKFQISRRDKTTRMFYLERTVEEVMNGDGTMPDTDMFAKFPRTPSDSTPATPGGPRRRIRCKMCRQELATREHMLDHGQLGPSTPAVSRRPSTNDPGPLRRPSTSQPRSRLGSSTDTRPRRPSLLSFGDSLSMSTMTSDESQTGLVASPEAEDGEATAKPAPSPDTPHANKMRRSSSGGGGAGEARRPAMRPFAAGLSRSLLDSLSMSALETEDDSEGEPPEATSKSSELSLGVASLLGRRMSDAVLATLTEPHGPPGSEPQDSIIDVSGAPSPSESPTVTNGGAETPDIPTRPPMPQTHFSSSSDMATQLNGNPALAGLRGSLGMAMTPLSGKTSAAPISPPILMNPKCAGYFVEPMKWMEPQLESGQLAGKIMCPNKKCNAKLGNYDWAGVRCGCNEWVTPGFCIHRSKVDEIVG